jgi:hypothetical protein
LVYRTRLAVNLGSQDEVALREPVDDVGEEPDVHPTPGESEVRMMALVFGDAASPVHERERLAEIGEG